MSQTTIVDIQPILNDVNSIIKNGIQTILYDHAHKYLNRELEKYKQETEREKEKIREVIKIIETKLSSLNN